MTTVRRLVSGNLAGVGSMVANLGGQIATVPLFLHAWGAQRFATWLALTTAAALAALIDTAHLDYLGFETLRLPPGDRSRRAHVMCDAVPVFALFGLAEVAVLAAFLWSPWAPKIFGVAPASHDLLVVRAGLLAMFAVWLLFQVPVGLLGRGLTSVGHFAATAWWYLAVAIGQLVGPALVAAMGGGLGMAVAAYLVATVVMISVNAWHYLRIARREALHWTSPDVATGGRRLLGGMTLGAANVIEYFQQTGFRLVLLPVLGAAMVAFATMRTVANVVQQGLLTLVNPMVPELMRYVSARDRHRTALMMSVMLYVTVVALCPGVVALQAIVRPVYAAWTLGKLSFDPLTFTLLSCSLLVSAWSQASRAVVRGNNLVRAQTAISAATGAVLLGVTFATVGRMGVRGAALGVLAAESLRAGAFFWLSLRWFARESFTYPARATAAAALAVAATVATVFVMALYPGTIVAMLLLYAVAWVLLNGLFWRALGGEERATVAGALGRIRARFSPAAAR